MNRGANPRAFELAAMEEAHPRRQVGNHSGGAMHVGRKNGRGACFVVILEEAGHSALVVERRAEVLADVVYPASSQVVEERLVIGVVNALAEKNALEAPIDLREKQEIRFDLPASGNGGRPERLHAEAPCL